MGITQDLTLLERQLGELISTYERYFIGLEKREPLQLLSEVEKMVRYYANISINNTMFRHKYTMQVARFNTYRERWNRTLRLIDEGKHSRERFICDLHERHRGKAPSTGVGDNHHGDNELDRLYKEFCEARKSCNMPVENLSREMVAATIAKSRPALVARLGTDDLAFRVVVENGKPKIKARQRK